jgi:hypothetical protein
MSTTVKEAPPSGVEVSARPWLAHGNPALRGPILLATDGAGKSGAALIAAQLLARRLDVPLEVVSILEPQLAYGAALGGTPVYLPEVDDSRRERRQAARQSA